MRSGVFPFIFLLFAAGMLRSQTKSPETHRFGFFFSYDYAYNFHDKVITPGLIRKWSIGASFTNKKRQFVVLLGAGIKGAKIMFYSPDFRTDFLVDVEQHFTPIQGYSEDSVVAAIVGRPGKRIFGDTYSQYLEAGFMLNNKLKPSLILYYGGEQFLLHSDALRHFEDPKYGDINYTELETIFYEIKAGVNILPFLDLEIPATLNLQAGYKLTDYGHFNFGKVALASYTTGALADKYRFQGKFTLGLTFVYWTNWGQ